MAATRAQHDLHAVAAVQLGVPVAEHGRQHAAQQARRGFQHRDGQALLARRGRHFQADEAAADHHHRQTALPTQRARPRGDAAGIGAVAQRQHVGRVGTGQRQARGVAPVASTRPV
jgi:hypothetical protein